MIQTLYTTLMSSYATGCMSVVYAWGLVGVNPYVSVAYSIRHKAFIKAVLERVSGTAFIVFNVIF